MSLSILSSKALALQEPIIKEYSIMFISKACKKPSRATKTSSCAAGIFVVKSVDKNSWTLMKVRIKVRALHASSMKASSIGDVNSWIRIERYASNILPKEILERSSLQQLYFLIALPSRSSLSPVY
ncbi:hypothetical protein V6N11_079859 [Hibiscus sabdariffa]|uniref:Uncharacterized protein n=1 Tax=Hibiscus sabdariffa TaxID=183260 RepID=A0ABR2RWM8_9ROSI